MISQTGKISLRQNRGFTFIELALATIVILILVGLATPLFRKPFSDLQLKNTGQTIVRLIRYAQAKAIAERRYTRINFDLDQGTFWSTVKNEDSLGQFQRIEGKWGQVFKAPKGTSIYLERPLITFYPDGSCDQTEIKLSDGKGKDLSISIEKNIGYVNIQE